MQYPRLGRVDRGVAEGRTSIVFSESLDWDEAHEVGARLAGRLGLRVKDRLEGPDAWLWFLTDGETIFILAYSDYPCELQLFANDPANDAAVARLFSLLRPDAPAPDATECAVVAPPAAWPRERNGMSILGEERGTIRRRPIIPLHPKLGRSDDGGMLEDLPQDLESRVGYRIAYGEAARLAEMAAFDHGWGRDFAAGVGGEAGAIEKEVMQGVGHGIRPQLIELAVQDAVERRKPRW
jgi:hypothetical protein